MLCRNVCKKCYLENNDTDLCWSTEVEREWKVKRTIDCLELYKIGFEGENWWLNVDKAEPPKECPYKLEHIALSQNEGKFIRYEIINPSDPYTLEWENFKIACVSVMLVGNGKYALEPLTKGGRKMPPFIFGGAKEWFKEEFSEEFDSVVELNKQDISDCLRNIVIGDEWDREIYNETMFHYLDWGWNMEMSGKQLQWRRMWHEKKCSSINNIGMRADRIADELEQQIRNENNEKD